MIPSGKETTPRPASRSKTGGSVGASPKRVTQGIAEGKSKAILDAKPNPPTVGSSATWRADHGWGATSGGTTRSCGSRNAMAMVGHI